MKIIISSIIIGLVMIGCTEDAMDKPLQSVGKFTEKYNNKYFYFSAEGSMLLLNIKDGIELKLVTSDLNSANNICLIGSYSVIEETDTTLTLDVEFKRGNGLEAFYWRYNIVFDVKEYQENGTHDSGTARYTFNEVIKTSKLFTDTRDQCSSY